MGQFLDCGEANKKARSVKHSRRQHPFGFACSSSASRRVGVAFQCIWSHNNVLAIQVTLICFVFFLSHPQYKGVIKCFDAVERKMSQDPVLKKKLGSTTNVLGGPPKLKRLFVYVTPHTKFADQSRPFKGHKVATEYPNEHLEGMGPGATPAQKLRLQYVQLLHARVDWRDASEGIVGRLPRLSCFDVRLAEPATPAN